MLSIIFFILTLITSSVSVQFPSLAAFPVTLAGNTTEADWITVDGEENILVSAALSVPEQDKEKLIIKLDRNLNVLWKVSLSKVSSLYESFVCRGIAAVGTTAQGISYVVTGYIEGSNSGTGLHRGKQVHIKLTSDGTIEGNQVLEDTTAGSAKGAIEPSKPIADYDGNIFVAGRTSAKIPSSNPSNVQWSTITSDYSKVDSNGAKVECTSVSGREYITNAAMCKEAAISLGMSVTAVNSLVENSYEGRPPGCYWRSAGELYFNTDFSSTGTRNYDGKSLICLSSKSIGFMAKWSSFAGTNGLGSLQWMQPTYGQGDCLFGLAVDSMIHDGRDSVFGIFRPRGTAAQKDGEIGGTCATVDGVTVGITGSGQGDGNDLIIVKRNASTGEHIWTKGQLTGDASCAVQSSAYSNVDNTLVLGGYTQRLLPGNTVGQGNRVGTSQVTGCVLKINADTGTLVGLSLFCPMYINNNRLKLFLFFLTL